LDIIIFKVSKKLKKGNYHKRILTYIKRKETKKDKKKERKNYSPLPPKGISIALKTTNLFKLKN
jgi:hypothetical protein